jgi:hypothetical protein
LVLEPFVCQEDTAEETAHMDEMMQTPEELQTPEEMIAGMRTDELQELLEEMGFETTEEQASGIQQLVVQLGSLEAAIEALVELDDDGDARRAA